MHRRLRSLRLRLTLAYMLVFGLIQAAVCIVILAQREYRASAEYDAELAERARMLGEVVEIAGDGLISPIDAGRLPQLGGVFKDAQLFYQVRLLDGTLIDGSRNLGGETIDAPLPPIEELRRRKSVFTTLDDAQAERLLGRGRRMRVVTAYHVPAMGSPLILQVATDLAPLQAEISDQRQSFIMMSLLALIPAGLATWILAKRALYPLMELAKHFTVVSPRKLDQRIIMDDPPEELHRLNETVNEMFARLDAAFRAQDRFLTNAAHELKTPLSILLGSAQVLRQKARSQEEYEKYMRETESEMRRLARTIDGLLALARAHTADPTRRPVSANEFVTTALERCQRLARRSNVPLALQLAADNKRDREPIVRGDERLLVTMVENVTRNAVRLSPERTPVEVAVSMDDGQVRVVVRDRGPGIPAEDIPKIFSEFVTLPVGKRKSGGSGIGLALARSVAHLHGGSVEASNRAGGGAEFTITLPLASTDGEARAENNPTADD